MKPRQPNEFVEYIETGFYFLNVVAAGIGCVLFPLLLFADFMSAIALAGGITFFSIWRNVRITREHTVALYHLAASQAESTPRD